MNIIGNCKKKLFINKECNSNKLVFLFISFYINTFICDYM